MSTKKEKVVTLVKAKKKQNNMNKHLGSPNEVEDIKSLFSDGTQSESDIVKELFSAKSIKSRTEVSDKEISLISRLYFVSEFTDNKTLGNLLQNFLELKLSRKRKSREEFIGALKNLPSNDMNMGNLGGLK